MKQAEAILAKRVAIWLRTSHRDILWRFDLAADVKTTIGVAMRFKEMNPHLGWPDLFISEARGGYHGLYIEIKKDRSEVFTKSGTLRKNRHIREQAIIHEELRRRGYRVEWGFSFEGITSLIDSYLVS